jgi:hypothetical protein
VLPQGELSAKLTEGVNGVSIASRPRLRN